MNQKSFQILMAKYIILILYFFVDKSFAVSNTGAATVLKPVIRKIELCMVGSTNSNCLDPKVIFTGSNTLTAATEHNLANLSIPLGDSSYTYMQFTLERSINIKGDVYDGSNVCYTSTNNNNMATCVTGSTSSSHLTEITAFIGFPSSSFDHNVNSVSAISGGVAQEVGTLNNDDEFIQLRIILDRVYSPTNPIQSIKTYQSKAHKTISWRLSNALAYEGGSDGCTDTGAQGQGLYASIPDISIEVH